MDVYHKVLLKLYQVTGGKDSQIIDLKDLVKGLGFLGNYEDISQMLSGQGWIAETTKINYVRITHWGVKEIKKFDNGESNGAQVIKTETARLIAETRQFLILIEEFSTDSSRESLVQVQKKLNEINLAINKLQASLS